MLFRRLHFHDAREVHADYGGDVGDAEVVAGHELDREGRTSKMTRKQRRLSLILAGAVVAGFGLWLIVRAAMLKDSIAFFNMAGLDYVSCSPLRIPIARIAAAQAAVGAD